MIHLIRTMAQSLHRAWQHRRLPDGCICDGPGHCPLMGRHMSRVRWRECREKPSYFRMFLKTALDRGHRPDLRDGRPHRDPPVTVRNLAFHLYPSRRNTDWYDNVLQLTRRIEVFNGRRVAAIAHDDHTEPPAVVREMLRPYGFEILEVRNDPVLREVATLMPLLNAVQNANENEALFYCHTKGNTTTDDRRGARLWRRTMYHYLLDRHRECMNLLRDHAVVCTTKMRWPENEPFTYPSGLRRGTWMPAGTFLWLRHNRVFSRPEWRNIALDRYGAESWLGGFLPENEAHSVYQPWPEDTFPNGSPYSPSYYPDELDD